MRVRSWVATALVLLVVGVGAGILYGRQPQPNKPAGAVGGEEPVVVQAGGTGSPAGGNTAPASVATSVKGGEIVVTFLNAIEARTDGQLAFAITFDNHAINLGDVSLDKQASLKSEPGEAITTGFTWQQEGTGHHVAGLLTAKNQGSAGKPVVTGNTRSLTLERRNVQGAGPRVFRFDNGGWKIPGDH